jgi:hypothetical protein
MGNKNAMELLRVKMVRAFKFGVEMEIAELVVTKEEFAAKLRAKGLRARALSSAQHYDYNEWKVEPDASVQGGAEIVSPVLSDFRELQIVCQTLEEVGAKVDKRCGLHVHHDASDYTTLEQFKNLYQMWAKHEETMMTMLPLSRREDNRFCKPIEGAQLEKVLACDTMADFRVDICGAGSHYYTEKRYYHINTCSYVKHGTIEFRGHSGTIDFEKIEMWVRLTNRILEMALATKKVRPKTAKMLEREANDENMRARHMNIEFDIGGTDIAYYIRKRRKSFVSYNKVEQQVAPEVFNPMVVPF